MNNKKWIIFDLDGTLSILGDRLKYLTGKKDWDSFYEHCDEDSVNEPVAAIYRLLKKGGYKIKIVTGRRETVVLKTYNWLINNDLEIENENLHMRKDGDTRHDVIVKPELVADFINDISMVFEDRSSMVDKWRELGITCLQVAAGDF
jgi:acid phosphatase class B